MTEVARLGASGATTLQEFTGHHVVMVDPEGNEFRRRLIGCRLYCFPIADRPAAISMAVPSYSHPEYVTINKAVWMSPQPGVPVLRQVVLDTTDVRALAEFYRRLLDLQYRPGDEHPGADAPDPRGQDWLVLRRLDGSTALAFQKVEELPPATWPTGPHPQMLHLDLTVPNRAELDAAHQRALALGARVLKDRSDDVEEPLWVYADPSGHPFCIFVVPAAGG